VTGVKELNKTLGEGGMPQLCLTHMTGKLCPKGDKCRFMHGEGDRRFVKPKKRAAETAQSHETLESATAVKSDPKPEPKRATSAGPAWKEFRDAKSGLK
jgi:hypothetical protein